MSAGRVITTFTDGSLLEYDKGKFDNWCIYLTRPNSARYAPTDTQYFQQLQTHHYKDICQFYDAVDSRLNPDIISQIKNLNYDLETIITITIVYAGMVAEENKQGTRLGKRIKRLGLHQLLVEKMPPREAANYSRGLDWRQIALECRVKGF